MLPKFQRRSIETLHGVICKLRNFVNSHILKNLYYSLIYPYLIYEIVAWGNTYTPLTNPLFLLQKKLVRIIAFSDYLDNTNPIFLAQNILKLQDLVFYYNALFMYDFHSGNLTHIFSTFFSPVSFVKNIVIIPDLLLDQLTH